LGLQGVDNKKIGSDNDHATDDEKNSGSVGSSDEELDDLCKVLAGIGCSSASKGRGNINSRSGKGSEV
jgi:hypothetical protein